MVTIYTYRGCDTCRRATQWLQAQAIPYEERPIRETPPSAPEIRTMLGHYAGERRPLFNTSGRDYRERGLGAKLPELSDAEVIELLSTYGNLVKRPFLLTARFGLVGFKETVWAAQDWSHP